MNKTCGRHRIYMSFNHCLVCLPTKSAMGKFGKRDSSLWFQLKPINTHIFKRKTQLANQEALIIHLVHTLDLPKRKQRPKAVKWLIQHFASFGEIKISFPPPPEAKFAQSSWTGNVWAEQIHPGITHLQTSFFSYGMRRGEGISKFLPSILHATL